MSKIYLVVLDKCIPGDNYYDFLKATKTKEDAEACLRTNAEFEWCNDWEMFDREDIDQLTWTDDYFDVQREDTRTTIYILEKELI